MMFNANRKYRRPIHHSAALALLILAATLVSGVATGQTRSKRATDTEKKPAVSTEAKKEALAPAAASAVKSKVNPSDSAASDQNENAAIAKVLGEVLTDERLTSYSRLVQMTERRMETDPTEMLEDYVLQKLIKDVYTTVSAEDKSAAELPVKYRHPSQRAYLRGVLVDHVRNTIKVDRSEEEAWYPKNVQSYESPEKIHAHHLFMGVAKDDPSSSVEAVRARIAKVKAEADAGTSFGLLAQKHSEAASGKSGGDIGWVTYRMPIGPESKPMNIALDSALFKLKAGDVSEVLQTSHGLHLMFAKVRQTTSTPTLDDLISSGILPGRIVNDKLTSKVEELLTKVIEKERAKVLATIEAAGAGDVSSTSPCIEIGGKAWTMRDLEGLYGALFTRAYRRAQGDKSSLDRLMNDVIRDEARIRAAIESKLDQRPEVARDLGLLGERAEMQKRFQAIVAEAFAATEQQAHDLYEKMKDSMRQRELRGHIISIKAEKTESPADRDKAMEKAKSRADEILKKLKAGADFEALAREVSQDDYASSGGLIERHAMRRVRDDTSRVFDSLASALKDKGQLSDAQQTIDGYAIVRLDESWPGEPPTFDEVKQGLQRQAQNDNQQKARAQILQMLEQKKLVEWLPGAEKYGKKAAGK
jgi:parvulin-like peptidyl-prolyl isomerase